MQARTAYELSESQVTTPPSIVSLFWKLTTKHRKNIGDVLDMGAGDCRFSKGGAFKKYVGVEIDPKRSEDAILRKNVSLLHSCVFKHKEAEYDACIGNPPYVRHHDIEKDWQEKIVAKLNRELGISLNRNCNLYLYFLCLAILKTKDSGLVSLVIPYEWISRPSALALRAHIRKQKWNVTVYRFREPIFDGVLTTASVSVIDKSKRDGKWTFFDITDKLRVVPRRGVTESGGEALEYAARGSTWALRGMSPGSQKIFTLTEGERIHSGLKRTDVVPCVTTLKDVPRSLRMLTKESFKTFFVDAGARCWLIRSYAKVRSSQLQAYLDSVPEERRNNYTCLNQSPWYKFKLHPVPLLLFGSGFIKFGPKVLINTVGARAVGSVWGIHSANELERRALQKFLLKVDFEKKIVPHAMKLKKVEVKQLNGILNAFAKAQSKHGHRSAR